MLDVYVSLPNTVFHGPMSVCAKFGANWPIDGAFMAK